MKDEIEKTIVDVVKDLFRVEVSINLVRPEEAFGDYATNVALQLSKKAGKNPRDIALALKDELNERLSGKCEVSVAGAGFLNIRLSDEALRAVADTKPAKHLSGQTVLVEYSDPNPFKPLHAGHLYTTLVGDTVARLIQNAGAKVVRINYSGDVGRHVAISMWSIIKKLGGENPEKLAEIAESERPKWLGDCYVEGNRAFGSDEAAKAAILEINKRVYEVHSSGDKESPFAQIYWTTRQWSYDYFAELYEQLQVIPFDRFIPESEVTPLGLKTVREQLANGVYEESEGAVIFDGEKYGLHKRVFINSQGLPTYETKDVGLLLIKWHDYNYDKSIYITANEQAQYMQVMLKSVEQFDYEPAHRSYHLTHGTVKLEGGAKMSSREGNIVTAIGIIDAANRAGIGSGFNPNHETVLAAIKYAFAKNRIGGDIIYNPKDSIALEGNSGPYLQYAHARARSILMRASESARISGDQLRSDAHVPDNVRSASVLSDHPKPHTAIEAHNTGGLQADERKLLRKISEYAEVVDLAAQELMPHLICTYLYELAQEFNRFYERNRVVGDKRETERFMLVEKYATTLKSGLNLLGIVAPEQM